MDTSGHTNSRRWGFERVISRLLFPTCRLFFNVSMPLSDCKYGTNPQKDHNYCLHSLPMAEDYHGKKPVRTFFDFRHLNVSENVDVKSAPRLSLTNLRSISKVKVVSFLMGLTLTFLIMASYILTWDKKGLLFTPSPDQFRPVVILTSATAAETSSKKNLIDMKLLVRLIGSKLEYTPRKVPDEKDVIETDSHVSLRCKSVDQMIIQLVWQITNTLQSALL